jgi:hypothetical protein
MQSFPKPQAATIIASNFYISFFLIGLFHIFI